MRARCRVSGGWFQASGEGGLLAVLVLAMLAWPSTARAQSPLEFFPRTDFFMDAEHLYTDQLRFRWGANFLGDVDLVGWRGGSVSFLANYQLVLGNQLRNFDPNQGNYTLDGVVTHRVAGVDVSGQFHHISRHLADRPKIPAVDWNMVGIRLRKRATAGALSVDARADLRGTIKKSFVDYDREVEAALQVRYALRPRVAVMESTNIRIVGVDGSRNRGAQTGARSEAGVHLTGGGGAVELFLAAERRIDPYPTEFGTVTWVTAGFRLTSR